MGHWLIMAGEAESLEGHGGQPRKRPPGVTPDWAFSFLIIYDCLIVRMRTLFVLREQTVVSGFLLGTGLRSFSRRDFHRSTQDLPNISKFGGAFVRIAGKHPSRSFRALTVCFFRAAFPDA